MKDAAVVGGCGDGQEAMVCVCERVCVQSGVAELTVTVCHPPSPTSSTCVCA